MLKKYSVLTGIIASVSLLIFAPLVYPGGSVFDKNSIGFNWTKNFISNLLAAKAENGSDNPARIWADAGMIFLSVSIALFFINFSRKIPIKSAADIIKYLGAGNLLFTFLVITPLHHGLMVSIASTFFLLGLFYVTVFIFKSRLHLFKFLCIICLLIFYGTLYLYGTGNWNWLPIMQKITFISSILLVLAVEYFTRKEDFEHIKTSKKIQATNCQN
jgi:hypothetical protein